MLRWTLADGVHAAYSTVADGDMRHAACRQRFFSSLGVQTCVLPKHVHGTVIADAFDESTLSIADGVVTDTAAVAVAVLGADCPGLCITAPDALVVAHCGWRGTAGGIVAAAVGTMKTHSSAPIARWNAFIGPGICGDHYEVDSPVINARSWPDRAMIMKANGRAQLDIPTAIAADLVSHGVTSITLSNTCTFQDERLWSFRRGGAGINQIFIAWRTQCR